jgi:hypothetical protein
MTPDSPSVLAISAQQQKVVMKNTTMMSLVGLLHNLRHNLQIFFTVRLRSSLWLVLLLATLSPASKK